MFPGGHRESGALIDADRLNMESAVMEELANRELVLLAQSGDRRAFDALYYRHARMVHGVLLARVRVEEADDLTQETFLAAWRQLRSLREPEAFCGWLLQIARRRAADHYRRMRPAAELDDSAWGAHPPADAEAMAALRALQSLPETYRETLLLRLVEGMTGAEIAERTGLAPGSVRVNLYRGMKLLREKLTRGTNNV